MPVVSMSAFEGKADILDAPCKCPLMTQSGHSELLVQNPVFAAMAAGMKKAKARWSQQVTEHSDALDLEKGVFKLKNPKSIALSLKRSAEHSQRRKSDPYRSAMSMLNFYINRAGKKLFQTPTVTVWTNCGESSSELIDYLCCE